GAASGPEGFGSRSDAFGQGVNGDLETVPALTPSLQESGQRQNSMTPHAFRPESALDQFMTSANGMSETDAGRRLIGGGNAGAWVGGHGMLTTQNGGSFQTSEAI